MTDSASLMLAAADAVERGTTIEESLADLIFYGADQDGINHPDEFEVYNEDPLPAAVRYLGCECGEVRSMTEDIIEMEMPRWMVKQLLGKVVHDRNNSITERGEKDAEQIEHLLRHYLEAADD